MLYILGFVAVAIAAVLIIFTGIWGGLVWIAAIAAILAVALLARARTSAGDGARMTRTRPDPPPTPRAARGGVETAHERVGQE
jgi:hypothetical protein